MPTLIFFVNGIKTNKTIVDFVDAALGTLRQEGESAT